MVCSRHRKNSTCPVGTGVMEEEEEANEVVTGGGVSLPTDLIVHILVQLPAKVLCQFRCVSKLWLAMLSPSPNNPPLLLQLHRERSKRTPLLLFTRVLRKFPILTIQLSSVDAEGRLHNQFKRPIGTSGGSLTWEFARRDLICFICDKDAYVCNPSTQEFVQLQYSPELSHIHAVSLGFLPSTNEYKIVNLFSRNPNGIGEIGCQVLTLTEGVPNSRASWRVIGNCPQSVCFWKPEVCVGGAIYWMIKEESFNRNCARILSLDLEREEFEIILFSKLNSYSNSQGLLALKGSLCVVDYNSWTAVPTMDIWMLRDRSNGFWVKEFSFTISLGHFIEILDHVHSGDDDDGEILIKSEKEGLLLYSIDTKSIRKIQNLYEHWNNRPRLCYDSLFSLGS